MKKTILAMAVPALLAAGAVNAATVYDQDGVTVSIGGAAEVQIIQGYEFDKEDVDLDVRLDDGELNFGIDVAVNDSLTALGYFDFENEGGSVNNTELWAGFKGDFGQLTAGRMYTLWDSANINEDIELGLKGVNGSLPASGNDVIKYEYEGDAFWFGVAHNLKQSGAEEETFKDVGGTLVRDVKVTEASHTDAGVGASFAGVDLSAYFVTGEKTDTNNGTKGNKIETDAFQVSAVYNVEAFTVGASYTDFEEKNGGVQNKAHSGHYVELLAGYGVGDFQYYLGYNFGENDDKSDGSNIYANATYKMHSNVKTYVELGWAETKEENAKSDDATGFLVGMEVKF
ncbi:porin [Grimontia sp. NTOU-MAR1]|uniref:porin n=1 Tax=Grimontia sp. NTOU-MAR1 TaxID=3111011 RepID=UPI002DBA38CE|nr:porin [Grimontia sp. NTOU-MAR1]WRV97570.1 porin [Grimontia sp. NTOU-MAR1]